MHEEKILTSIAQKYYDQVFGYCNIKLHSEQDAYDCTQDVFRLFLEKYRKGEITITEKTSHWLLSAAKNTVKNYIKNSARHAGVSIDSCEITLADEKSVYIPDISFSDIIDPEEYRIIHEKYILGKSTKEMAEIHGISEAAVYKRTERIIHKIRKKYQAENQKKNMGDKD